MEVHRDRYMHHMWLDGSCKIYRPCNVHEVRRRQNGILRSRQGRQHSRFLGCADVISWRFAALAVVAGILIPWEQRQRRRLLNNLAGRIAAIYMGWPAVGGVLDGHMFGVWEFDLLGGIARYAGRPQHRLPPRPGPFILGSLGFAQRRIFGR